MPEFTGERVIPGHVDPDLWNEHYARYLFAARLARNKRVLDIACGAGYGSAELAHVARAVTGIDVSGEAIAYAREHYQQANLTFQTGSATSLDFADSSFDLVVAFEVIEHLAEYRLLLAEAKRLLAPGGQLIVSTPNRLYYEETRRISGPNPYHEHEFEFAEFREELGAYFPHAAFFLQNHVEAILFQPVDPATATEVRGEAGRNDPAAAHFFIAVCAGSPQTGAPRYLYLPSTSNVLREREQHIAKLEGELAQKSEWLAKSLTDHDALVKQHRELKGELEQRNRWAAKLNTELEQANQRVDQVQKELAAEQASSRQVVSEYEAKIAELDADIASKVAWARETEQRLTAERDAKATELAKCVEILHQTEKTLEERTKWAQTLDTNLYQLNKRLNHVSASRWYKLGRTLGLGPEIRES